MNTSMSLEKSTKESKMCARCRGIIKFGIDTVKYDSFWKDNLCAGCEKDLSYKKSEFKYALKRNGKSEF